MNYKAALITAGLVALFTFAAGVLVLSSTVSAWFGLILLMPICMFLIYGLYWTVAAVLEDREKQTAWREEGRLR